MTTRCCLVGAEHIPERAAFPAIDAHNHLWGDWNVENLLGVMDDVGVVSYCDLTANAKIAWAEGGYVITPCDIRNCLERCVRRWPGRFYAFTMATFARPPDEPLFDDADEFVRRTVELLREHVAGGAMGLKLTKELGLHFRDAAGRLVALDDPRLAPIWDEAAALGVPVLMHQSDPCGFFQPVTPENEHYESLKKYSNWSFADPKFPRKAELLRRRDNLVRRHPRTTFILPHVANFPENLGYVSDLLDENPNTYIDVSARIDELGRQPYTAREFIIRHQDRVLFGTDMPASAEVYRCYFRFLETFDEHFFPPDYDGTFELRRWPICGIGLPKDVLAKIYYKNVLKLLGGLKDALAGLLDADERLKGDEQ